MEKVAPSNGKVRYIVGQRATLRRAESLRVTEWRAPAKRVNEEHAALLRDRQEILDAALVHAERVTVPPFDAETAEKTRSYPARLRRAGAYVAQAEAQASAESCRSD